MLTKMQAKNDDAQACLYAAVFDDLGNFGKALEWTETAYRLRDTSLVQLNVDPFVSLLREEPRFQAMVRELNFLD